MHPLPASKYVRAHGSAASEPISKVRQALSKTDTLVKIASLVAALIFVYLGL